VTFRDQALLAALTGTIRFRAGLRIQAQRTGVATPTVEEMYEAAARDAIFVADLVVRGRRRCAKKRVHGVALSNS